MAGHAKTRDDAAPSELRLEGLDVAPGVLETIVMLAAQDVEGVACVESTGLAGLMHKAGRAKPVEVAPGEGDAFAVTVHLAVEYGRPLRGVAAEVQRSVADALLSQTGRGVSAIDVYVDGVAFPG